MEEVISKLRECVTNLESHKSDPLQGNPHLVIDTLDECIKDLQEIFGCEEINQATIVSSL